MEWKFWNSGISPAVSLIIARMDQFQLRFFPWYTGSLVLMIQTPKTNWLNMHIPLLSLSQLIHSNKVRQRRKLGISCHNSAHETPLSIYVAFFSHSQTLRRLLVDKFHDLGLSISWSNVSFIIATWEQCTYVVWTWWCNLCNKVLFKCFHNICCR